MALNASETVTAYNVSIPPQDQAPGAGLDEKLKPAANFTQLEYYDDNGKPYLKEYEGRGQLQNKTAIVTGDDSGIGRSVTILFAREGADVSIAYLPEEEPDAQTTKSFIEAAGRKASLIPINLIDDGAPKQVIDGHLQAFGKLNVLVNNAARQEVCTNLADIDMVQVQKTFQLNVNAMFALSKYALQHMKLGDSIVNSCSVAAFMGNPGMVDYSSSKGAIVTFSRVLAQKLAPKGIRVDYGPWYYAGLHLLDPCNVSPSSYSMIFCPQ